MYRYFRGSDVCQFQASTGNAVKELGYAPEY